MSDAAHPGFFHRRWKWLAGGAGVLVLLGVGGPFVFIHFVEGTPPAKLALTATGTTTATGSATTGTTTGTATGTAGSAGAAPIADGSYAVAAGSEAGYRVKETLFGQSTTAVGRTSKVTGSIALAGKEVTKASFSVDLASVTSDQSQRDNQFRGRIMDVARYPTATFVTTAPVTLPSIPAAGQKIEATATGTLMLHGTTRPVTLTLQATRSATGIQVAGSIPVTFADYGVDNPSGGPASVGDTGTVEVLLNLAQG